MIIYKNLDEIEHNSGLSIALGSFDGIHLGHEKLIKRAAEEAKNIGIKSAVFTFSNHPRDLLPGAKRTKNIITQKEKAKIIESLGIDYLISIKFNKEIMEMRPHDFIENILLKKLNMKIAVCGFNYHFGRKAEGNAQILKALGDKCGFTVIEMSPIKIGNCIISSSKIRECIENGKMDMCRNLMGRNYELLGEVVHGNRIGRTMGFPTANIMIPLNMVTPSNGVYITKCHISGKTYDSITNIGVRPTIDDDNRKNAETYIMNFSDEVYGKNIRVEFIRKLRDEIKFASKEDLRKQIEADVNALKSQSSDF